MSDEDLRDTNQRAEVVSSIDELEVGDTVFVDVHDPDPHLPMFPKGEVADTGITPYDGEAYAQVSTAAYSSTGNFDIIPSGKGLSIPDTGDVTVVRLREAVR